MRGSQLDRRITIQANTPTQDSEYGTVVEGWATFAGAARIPAQVQDTLPSKSEATADGLRLAKHTARVRIRYLAGVTADMRVIVHGESDRTMTIIAGPAEIGRREWLEFMCEDFTS